MKAYYKETYRHLCGTTNKWILELPAMIHDMGILLEVVPLLYILSIIEVDQLEKFAELLARVDKDTPVMLLAFFQEFKLSHLRPPTLDEIVAGYTVLKKKLNKVRIGNIGVFCKTLDCINRLIEHIGREAIAL
jgi:pyruvate formate lyase activating enzyme